MKLNFFYRMIPAALALSVPAALWAAPWHPASATAEQQARRTLMEACDQARAAADASNHLELYIGNPLMSADSHQPFLWQMKTDINRLNHQIAVLDSERNSLSNWERDALDRVKPLALDAAQTAQKTIEYYNANLNHLWSPEYKEMAMKVESDSRQIASTLHNFIKYEGLQKEEQKVGTQISGGMH